MINLFYTYRSLLVCTLVVVLGGCSQDEDRITRYTSKVDTGSSYLSERDKYTSTVLFSTDDGKTFGNFPTMSVGQTYLVKVNNVRTSEDITANDNYVFDWSSSVPAPNGNAAGEIAEFTMKEVNDIVVKLNEKVCPFDANAWTGEFEATEYYGSQVAGPYHVELVADAANPKRVVIKNFYDSGLEAYIDFDDATGTVKFPDGQVFDGEAITKSTGKFYSCKGKITLELNFDGGDFIYRLEKE